MEARKKGWNVLCEDESIVLYDSVVRAVWAKRGSRPFILTTGSHARTCLFGALSMDKRQLFRQYERIDNMSFLKFLREAKRTFGSFLLFLDKSSVHRSRNVKKWLDENKGSIRVMWFPTGCPELNPVEEGWSRQKILLWHAFYIRASSN